MKNIILLAFIAGFAPLMLVGQHTLSIEIDGLKNNKGKVLLELSSEKGEKIAGFMQPIDNAKCLFEIKDLKPGKYSFKYFHDENSNEELDTNMIGMPKEGFGFANNAKGKFGPPQFEKTIFTVQGDSSLKCTIQYL